jgi:hypothetical protein
VAGNTEKNYNCTLGTRGRLVELNVTSGGATERAEIWGNKGGMGVHRAQGDRFSQAQYIFPIINNKIDRKSVV